MLDFGMGDGPLALVMGEVALVLGLTGLLLGGVLSARRERWVDVLRSWVGPAGVVQVSRSLSPLLARFPRSSLHAAGSHAWIVTVTRARRWALIAAILGAVVTGGLSLLLLLVREQGNLHVLVRPHPDGAEVEIYGATTTAIVRRMSREIDRLFEVPAEVRSA